MMMRINDLRFGTAGIPECTKGNTFDGIKDVRKLGLGAMELEFVRSLYIKKEKAPDIKNVAQKNDVILTAHASYFINLNAVEEKKIAMSKQYITSSARVLAFAGGYSCCFHAGYYLKMDKDEVYKNIKKRIGYIVQTLQDEGIKIWVRPELTGKATQWGDLPELLQLSSELDMVLPCFDFAHYHARHLGKHNTYDEFVHALKEVEKYLGKEGLQNMHIHIAGINYGDKGERNHLNLNDSDMNYEDLVKAWKDYNIKGVVICESPNIEQDALLLKNTYDKM